MKHEVLPERLINDANFVIYPWSTYLHKNVFLNLMLFALSRYIGGSTFTDSLSWFFRNTLAKIRTSSWLFQHVCPISGLLSSWKMKTQISGLLKTFQDQWEPCVRCAFNVNQKYQQLLSGKHQWSMHRLYDKLNVLETYRKHITSRGENISGWTANS